MVPRASPKNEKVRNPATRYDKPHDIVKDTELSSDERRDALNTWEQDARQLMTASSEGMPGRKEGLESQDHHRFGEVVRAKDKLGENPKHKPSR
jgi:hypothetical protein